MGKLNATISAQVQCSWDQKCAFEVCFFGRHSDQDCLDSCSKPRTAEGTAGAAWCSQGSSPFPSEVISGHPAFKPDWPSSSPRPAPWLFHFCNFVIPCTWKVLDVCLSNEWTLERNKSPLSSSMDKGEVLLPQHVSRPSLTLLEHQSLSPRPLASKCLETRKQAVLSPEQQSFFLIYFFIEV